MNWEAVGALSEAFGVVVVVGSLLFVGFQIRQSARETRAASMNSIMNDWVDFYHRISEDHDLSDIIYKGAKLNLARH